MYETIMQIVVDASVALMPIAAGYVITIIRRHFKQQEITRASQIAHAAVNAVEMIALASGFDSRAKLAQAVNRSRQLGEQYGIRLSDEQWQTFVEQAVLNMRAIGDEVKRAE